MGLCRNHWKWLQLRSCKTWCKSVRKTLVSWPNYLFELYKENILGLSALRAPTVRPYFSSFWDLRLEFRGSKNYPNVINKLMGKLASGKVGSERARERSQQACGHEGGKGKGKSPLWGIGGSEERKERRQEERKEERNIWRFEQMGRVYTPWPEGKAD